MPQVEPPATEPQNERCDHCGQRIPLARKELLNKQMVKMLKRAAGHVMTTMRNDFMVRDFTEPAEFKQYNWFSHLRLHGLIFKQRTADGKELRGRWGITRNGWAFLRGQKELPAYVLVRNNAIQSRADALVGFNQVWRGEDTMQTSFEYFDDDGNPVGIRPVYPATNNNQARLI
jgi:hypothetical protein